MIEFIKWLFADAWHYAWMMSAITFGFGWLLGSLKKTQPYEIQMLKLKGELDSVLHTIELKSKVT